MKLLAGVFASGVVLTAQAAATSVSTSTHDDIVTEFPLEQAMVNIFTQPRIERMSVVFDDETKPTDFLIQITKGEDTFFEGLYLHQVTMQQNLSSELAAPFELTTQHYFTLDPFRIYGLTADDGAYVVSTEINLLPKTARSGDSGAWDVYGVYHSRDAKRPLYKMKRHWRLSRIDDKTAWLCVHHAKEEPPSVVQKEHSYYCYSINAQGDLLDYKSVLSYFEDGEKKRSGHSSAKAIHYEIDYLKHKN